VRVLQLLPADHPSRPRFEQQFKRNGREDRHAPSRPTVSGVLSLLDPDSYPAKEESGTGFLLLRVSRGA